MYYGRRLVMGFAICFGPFFRLSSAQKPHTKKLWERLRAINRTALEEETHVPFSHSRIWRRAGDSVGQNHNQKSGAAGASLHPGTPCQGRRWTENKINPGPKPTMAWERGPRSPRNQKESPWGGSSANRNSRPQSRLH